MVVITVWHVLAVGYALAWAYAAGALTGRMYEEERYYSLKVWCEYTILGVLFGAFWIVFPVYWAWTRKIKRHGNKSQDEKTSSTLRRSRSAPDDGGPDPYRTDR